MPKNNESVNRELYDLLDTRGYNPISRDSDVSQAGKTVPPEEADVFRFTFKQDGKDIDDAWATIDKARTLIVYYDKDIADKAGEKSSSAPYDDSWYGLLKFFKKWAHSRQLSFNLEPKEKLDSDMAQRTYMKKKEKIAEGYYPMGKAASYNDNIPTIKIILQHTRQIQEGEQRYRNVAKIFLENAQGERILAPTVKPGIAQIYARHLAEGGVPNDERWNHIKSLCEEYGKMAGFVRAVRGNQFNESAQRLVEAGLNHYTNLRESLSKMRGHRGYNAYFESWTPTLMETEGDETNLNELFVEETLDPRIESVMPILSKLSKNISEVKEVKELEEWADNLLEAPGAETLAHNQATEKSRLNAFDLDEDEIDDAEAAKKKMNIPAYQRKAQGGDWKVTQKDLDKIPAGTRTTSQGLAAHAKRIGLEEEDVEESGLQAYLGNKKYGKAGMDALRKAGRDGASKETMANIRAKYDKLDEEGMEEGYTVTRGIDKERYQERQGLEGPFATKSGKVVYYDKSEGKYYDPDTDMYIEYDDWKAMNEQDVAEGLDPNQRARLDDLISDYQDATDPSDYGSYLEPDEIIDTIRSEFGDKIADQVEAGAEKMHFGRHDIQRSDPLGWKKPVDRITKAGKMYKQDSDYMKNTIKSRYKLSGKSATEDVEEGLDANQKRVGQLGPTEKVKNNNIGKLVGANESVELSEMDKSQPSSDRGGESSGNPYAKGGKATPIKAKDAAKDAEKVLNKSMDKAHKKDVKEGQEDLDAILRIIRK